MKSFINIPVVFSWFVLCVTTALVLLATALIYNVFASIKKLISSDKITFPNLKFAR